MKKYTGLLLVFVVILGLAFCGNAQAANVTWDTAPGTVGAGNGTVTGGSGAWNTSNGNWTIDNGANNIAWVNVNNDTAVFGGTAGTVTNQGVSVGGLTFNTASYIVTNNTLTFGASGIISNSVAATIASALAGTGAITKNGGGTLTLSGANTYSGGLVINSGSVYLTSDSNLGATSGGLTFSGTGNITYPDGLVLNANRTVTFNAGANVSLANNITFNGILTGSGAFSVTTADGYYFPNPNNDFSGTITSTTQASTGYGLDMASIGDAPGAGLINLNNGTFRWIKASGGTTTFTNRQFALSGTTSPGVICAIGATSSQNLIISTDLLITGNGNKTLTLAGANTGNNRFAGSITNGPSSTISLTKSEAGTWALSGTNTFSGTITLTPANPVGPLIFQGIQAFPASVTSIVMTDSSSSQVQLKILDDGAGTISRTGANVTFTPSQTSAAGVTHFFVGNNSTANGGSNPSSTQTGSIIALGGLTMGAAQAGNFGATINLTGANGYKLQLASIAFPDLSGKTAGLTYTVKLNPTTAALVDAGGVTLFASSNTNASPVLNLDGTASGNEIKGSISDPANVPTSKALALTKSSSSVWTLSGTNTYTGVTTISAGLLRVNGSLSTGAVTVAAGSLGGTGTINGAVSVNGTSGIDLRDGTVGTLTINTNLAINGAAGANILYFELGDGASGSDKIVVTGDVSMATAGAGVIVLSQLGGSKLNAGTTNDLIEVTGTIPAASSFTLATTAFAGSTLSLQLDGTGKKLQVVVVADATAGPAATSWTGGVNTNWSNAGNWNSGAPGYLSDVTFYNAGANLNTAMDASFDINSLIFSTGATSAGTISGSRMLTIEATSGVGILVNTPSSGTPVHRINSMVGLGTNQTWTVNTNGSLTVAGAVSDFGLGRSLTKAGTGTLTLGGANTYTGGTVINAGKVIISANSNLGAANSALTFNGTSTLQLDATVDLGSRPIFLADGAIATFEKPSTSAFNLTTAGTVTGAGGVTLYPWNNGGATLTFSSSGNTFTGPILITRGTCRTLVVPA